MIFEEKGCSEKPTAIIVRGFEILFSHYVIPTTTTTNLPSFIPVYFIFFRLLSSFSSSFPKLWNRNRFNGFQRKIRRLFLSKKTIPILKSSRDSIQYRSIFLVFFLFAPLLLLFLSPFPCFLTVLVYKYTLRLYVTLRSVDEISANEQLRFRFSRLSSSSTFVFQVSQTFKKSLKVPLNFQR